MKTKVNVIVTYDDDTQDTFDCKVRLSPTRSSSKTKRNKLRAKYWGQIIRMIKGDKTRLVKISTRFWDEKLIMGGTKEYLYLMTNLCKVWFQPDQRDEFENMLSKKYGLASNTRTYSEKWGSGEDVDYFPIDEIANKTMSVQTTDKENQKKVTDEYLMSGFEDFLKNQMFEFLKSKSTLSKTSTVH